MAEPGDDPRHKFLEERVGTALGSKGSKFSTAFRKLATAEDAGRSIAEFINTPDVARLFVAEGPKDLVCFDTPPPTQKKKVVYFLKLQKVALTAENIAEVWGRPVGARHRVACAGGCRCAERDTERERVVRRRSTAATSAAGRPRNIGGLRGASSAAASVARERRAVPLILF